MSRGLLIVAAAALVGCATVQEVPVPYPVPCVLDIPERPALHAEQAWKTGDEWDRVKALLLDRLLLLAHAGRLEAALVACKAEVQ